MDRCPRCSFPIYGFAIECAKCRFPLTQGGTLCAPVRASLVGAEKSHEIRRKALAAVAIALLMKVYWGGHGPWPVPTDPTILSLRDWLEPLFLNGGIIGYAVGWVLRWF
ncbi:MAG TPA: hypothetical protein VGX94_08940 [Terriglobia bacterium]|nr:hypothetical protein [Terriglobia bacterium]HEV2499549.1 hypothetical protein [Terriglobia bacterium]